MKHLLILWLCAICLPVQAALNVLACEPEWAALTQAIGGEHVSVKSATNAKQDPHHIQARPSLISAVRKADMVICTGAELETGWLPVLLSKGANPKVRQAPGLFMAAEQVTLLDIPESVSRFDGDIHAAGNPHLQLSPSRMLTVAEKLAHNLGELDSANRDLYRQRFESLSSQWAEKLAALKTLAEPLKGMNIISHHSTFRYLEDWLELNNIAKLEPKPGIPPSPGHLAGLVSIANDKQVELIIHTSYQGSKASSWLAQRTEACALELPSTVSIGAKANQPATLLALYEAQIRLLLNTRKGCSN